MQEPKGSIHRMLVNSIVTQGTDAYARDCPDPKKATFGISVLTGQDDLEYHLGAENAEEMSAWVEALNHWQTVSARDN